MSRFLTKLDMEAMEDSQGNPLYNRMGRRLFQLLSPLDYSSDLAKMTIFVPTAFVTDLASVPRIPLVFDELGDICEEPAVVHDYLYSTATVPRSLADGALDEAMACCGISWIKRKLYWLGVRIGGAGHYGPEDYTA